MKGSYEKKRKIAVLTESAHKRQPRGAVGSGRERMRMRKAGPDEDSEGCRRMEACAG